MTEANVTGIQRRGGETGPRLEISTFILSKEKILRRAPTCSDLFEKGNLNCNVENG